MVYGLIIVLIATAFVLPEKLQPIGKTKLLLDVVSVATMLLLGWLLPVNKILRGIIFVATVLYVLGLIIVYLLGKKHERGGSECSKQ